MATGQERIHFQKMGKRVRWYWQLLYYKNQRPAFNTSRTKDEVVKVINFAIKFHRCELVIEEKAMFLMALILILRTLCKIMQLMQFRCRGSQLFYPECKEPDTGGYELVRNLGLLSSQAHMAHCQSSNMDNCISAYFTCR